MSEKNTEYLWVNLADVQGMGTIGPVGSPINFILPPSQLVGTVQKKSHGLVDEVYLVYEVESADDKEAGLQVIAKQKIERKVRTKHTVNPPSKHWEYV
jgi:hypothetical protein